MADMRNIIRQLAQPDGETVPLICVVDSVDKKARTIDCTPLNDSAPLLGVNLQANQGSDFGLCVFPKVGAFVVVGFVAEGSAGVVLLTDEVEGVQLVIDGTKIEVDNTGCRLSVGDSTACFDSGAITFNGGSLGGLAKVQELTDKLNELVDTVNALIIDYSAHVHTCAAPNSTSSPIVAPFTQTAAAFSKADYENTKVMH